MIHKILNQELELKLTGTLGIIYATERAIGHEPKANKQQDLIAILHTALKKSVDRKGNPLNENMPTLEDFTDCMTGKLINKLADDFWAQWNDLEGVPAEEQQKDNGKGED